MPLITSDSVHAFAGTITPTIGPHKIGLDVSSNPAVVKSVPKNVVARWTIQNFDEAPDCYRLFVNDGRNDYALRLADDGTYIIAYEGKPTSAHSHVWYIVQFPDQYYYIQDIVTRRAWKLNGTAIELAPLPIGNDDLKPFKFSFSF